MLTSACLTLSQTRVTVFSCGGVITNLFAQQILLCSARDREYLIWVLFKAIVLTSQCLLCVGN